MATDKENRHAVFLAMAKEADENAARATDDENRERWQRIARAYRGLAMAPDKHVTFACPHCGQKGEVVWSGEGKDRALISLSQGFHVEAGRLPGARPVIICDTCDEIDPAGMIKP